MPLRKPHGTSARAAPEVPMAEGAARGLPEPDARPERDHAGRIKPGEHARRMGRKGGLKKAQRARLAKTLGLDLDAPDVDPEVLTYLKDSEEWYRVHVAELARDVGGGECGAGPASIVASAALQLGASRRAFARGDAALASKLADSSRQNLITAHDLVARELKARETRARMAQETTGLARLQLQAKAAAPQPQQRRRGRPPTIDAEGEGGS